MSDTATPGPYAVFADDRSVIVSTADGTTRLARMLSANGADLANAHLFAAAQLGLELATDALPILEALRDYREELEGEPDEIARDLIERTKAFIAKAGGQ